MKFVVEHSDEIWNDFSDSNWHVPEFQIVNIKENSFLNFNFISKLPVSAAKQLSKLEAYIDRLSNIENREPIQNQISKIKKEEGSSPKDKKNWKRLIETVLDKIEEKEVAKVVVSRRVKLLLESAPEFDKIILKLTSNYPECSTFLYKKNKSIFFGSSPELIAKFHTGKIETDALAGSIQRGENEIQDAGFEKELLESEKIRSEHNLVVDYIKNCLAKIASNISNNGGTKVKKLYNIQHLWTKITAELTHDDTIFHLLKELYPTPAICGVPKEPAQAIIKKMEEHKRGLYSGVTGWGNLFDEGEFVIAIRSALSIDNQIYAFAGCGIVKDSNADQEWKETELKLSPILSLFSNENK
jgi:menaquinone-specific isochorismate synthase